MRPKELLHIGEFSLREAITRNTNERAAQKEPRPRVQFLPQFLHDLRKGHGGGKGKRQAAVLPFDLDLFLTHFHPSLAPCGLLTIQTKGGFHNPAPDRHS